MLFNSFSFLFLFLPITFVVWHLLKFKTNIRVALTWLSCASLFFYSVWNIHYLFVLLTSISVNFYLGGRILAANKQQRQQSAKIWTIIGVCFNLFVLIGFKYSYFIISNFFELFQHASPIDPIVLPLAISFVTFQKIAYLVDCKRGQVHQHNVIDYVFFVSFFPQLIAGPIVHHKPLIAQTKVGINPLFNSSTSIIAGFSFLGMGLFKKVILADSFARYATPVFDLAQKSQPSFEASWQAMLAYTLQLYFDFSAYSDMAIGLALLFGFKLPINFLSPYKATSIIDFWRRWHITLSTFLRDYLYIPLGGNRNGRFSHLRNLWITMLLAGIWHGAGWTFLLWGVFHGTFLIINQMLRSLTLPIAILDCFQHRFMTPIKIIVTFFIISIGWVLFRSSDLDTALNMYSALLHFSEGFNLSSPNWQSFGDLSEGLMSTSVNMGWVWICLGLFIVMMLPSSTEILKYDPTPNSDYQFKPHFVHGILVGIAFWFALKWMTVRPASEFLYFNF